jgi:hypothetical protein
MNFGAVKSLKLVVFLLYCLTFVRYTESSEDKPRLNGENTIEFLPLPEGIPYKTEIQPSQWILSSYEDIARKFALVLRNEPPYGKVLHDAICLLNLDIDIDIDIDISLEDGFQSLFLKPAVCTCIDT